MKSAFPTSPSTRRGFSLVEVVLALAVVAFAFVGILGLLPAGISIFHQAIDTSVCAQIAQRVIGDAQQTDFKTLVNQPDLEKRTDKANTTLRLPVRYFDDQGNEVVPSRKNALVNSDSLSNPEKLKIVYHVNTRVMTRTSVPKSKGQDSGYVATLTIQVANNPGNVAIKKSTAAPEDTKSPDRNLFITTPGVSILTYPAVVGSNQ